MKNMYQRFIGSGGMYIGTILFANFLNFLINAILGRSLSFSEFGLLTFINSIYYLISIFFIALIGTFNHWVAFLNARDGNDTGVNFYVSQKATISIISVIAMLMWIFVSPLSKNYFHLSNIIPFISFSPILLVGPIVAINKGYLQGIFSFGKLSIVVLSESAAKLIMIMLFLAMHLSAYIYLTIPLSVLISFIASVIFVQGAVINNRKTTKISTSFPTKFFLASIFTSISTTAYLSLDIILVQHFLLPLIAGEYAILSLVGKMIYFFGSIFNSLLVTFVSRDEGKGKSVKESFRLFFLGTVVLSSAIFLILGPFGQFFVPFLLGNKTNAILPYLIPYTLGMTLFTLISTVISFHLAKHEYFFALMSILSTFIMVLGISIFHKNILQVTYTILLSNAIIFVIIIFIHNNEKLFFKINRKITFNS